MRKMIRSFTMLALITIMALLAFPSYADEVTLSAPVLDSKEVRTLGASYSYYSDIRYKDLTSRQKSIYNLIRTRYMKSNKKRLKITYYNSAITIQQFAKDFHRARCAYNNTFLRYTSGLVVLNNDYVYGSYDKSGRLYYWFEINAKLTRSRAKRNTANYKKLKAITKKAIKGKSSTRAKVIGINNYVCKKLTFRDNSGTFDLALNGSYAKCTGYATLFQAMCETAGIKCVQVFGVAGEGHDWNQVLVNGTWYYVDPTWNDGTNNAYLLSKKLWSDHTEIWAKCCVLNFQQHGYKFGI